MTGIIKTRLLNVALQNIGSLRAPRGIVAVVVFKNQDRKETAGILRT